MHCVRWTLSTECVCTGGEEEITGGRTLQLAFIMRLGLSDDSLVADDEKNTNSVCVSSCSVGFAYC